MSEKFKEKIVNKLNDLCSEQPCPRCGFTDFDFVGVSRISVNTDADIKHLNKSMPVIITACRKCAYIAQHAMLPLNLKPDDDSEI
ncbi:hypothetical protein [Shewanella seohaensis]|uniref:hypothetical protein n=1 Tax=Shewanella seohaensis TaxID=755175 RepID=UPI0035B7FBCE